MAEVRPSHLILVALPEGEFNIGLPGEGDDSGVEAQIQSAVSVVSFDLKDGRLDAVLRLHWSYMFLRPGREPVTMSEQRDVPIAVHIDE